MYFFKLTCFCSFLIKLIKGRPFPGQYLQCLLHHNSSFFVADFVASGTGGRATHAYTGRDMPSSHRDLNLTNADFSVGGRRHRHRHEDHWIWPERDRRDALHPRLAQGPGYGESS